MPALEQLESDLTDLVAKYVPTDYKPTAFDTNCTVAVLADRNENGLCAADVTALLPHDTPGSRCWHEKEMAAEMREVSPKRWMLELTDNGA